MAPIYNLHQLYKAQKFQQLNTWHPPMDEIPKCHHHCWYCLMQNQSQFKNGSYLPIDILWRTTPYFANITAYNIGAINLQLTLMFTFLCRYATIYTMFPVFSLVLDKDVTSQVALTYPELYKELTKVRHIICLLFGSAVTSVFISIYFLFSLLCIFSNKE